MIQAFIEYLAIVNQKYAKAPSSHRGAEERWRWLRLLVVHASSPYVRHCPLVPVQMRSTEPMGSGGDAAPCKDTRQER